MSEDLHGVFLEEIGIAEDYPRFTKIISNSLEKFMATRVSAAMAIVGIVLSALGMTDTYTPLESRRLFISLTLDHAKAAAEWFISAGIDQ